MAAPGGNNTTPFFGCKISLISKSEIRYEGILYTIDPKESTIALAKVRSFGSEDRPVERPVPPRDDIFEFIIFRASDIKDLIVDDPPPAPALTDPAIIQAQHGTSTSFPSSFPQSNAGANASSAAPSGPAAAAPGPTAVASSGPAAVAPQTALQQLQASSKGSSSGVASKQSATGAVPKQSATGNKSQTDSSKTNRVIGENANPNYHRNGPNAGGQQQQQQQGSRPFNSNRFAPRHAGQQQQQQTDSSKTNRVIGENANPNYHRNGPNAGGQQHQQQGFRPFNSNRFAPRHGGQQQQQMGGGFRRGGFGGHTGGMQHRSNFMNRGPQSHHQNGPKFPPLPDGDFDFEKAQADFKILEEKLSALKLNGAVSNGGEGDAVDSMPEVPGIPASAIAVAALEQEEIPKEPCYNKTKSFFDSISCEALEREKGSNQRVDWKAERKQNRETFGVVSARRPTFYRVNNRGGFGGGGYRGGYHQQRGHNYNQHFQNRQNNNQGGNPINNRMPRTPNANSNVVSSSIP